MRSIFTRKFFKLFGLLISIIGIGIVGILAASYFDQEIRPPSASTRGQ